MTFVPRPLAGGDRARFAPAAWPSTPPYPGGFRSPFAMHHAPFAHPADVTQGFHTTQPYAAHKAIDAETLLSRAGVPQPILAKIMAFAEHWDVSPTEAALALQAVDPDALLRVMADAAGIAAALPGARLRLRYITPEPEPYRLLQSHQPLLLADTSAFALNARAFTPEVLVRLTEVLGHDARRLVLVDQPVLSRAVAETYAEPLTVEAADGLRWRHPRFCAASGAWFWQRAFVGAAAGLFMGAVVFAPRETVTIYSAVLSLMFFLTIALRLIATGHACHRRITGQRRRIRKLADRDLPVYTVLVAMYDEKRMVRDLVANLKALDYPAAKLDIKLVFEESDVKTIDEVYKQDLPPHFEVLVVPEGSPQTKPRALNYALQFARGDYLVIYDAEDRPERSQLRKAAGHFHDADPEVACLQARLVFDNFSENWLSRQCAIEYASLFGGILPMLDAARLPLPLGGTSNHFRIKALRGVGAWDAHNVTEDADLGMRLYRAGLRAEVLDSTTYEEAACQPGNWLRQRTRWLKGWLQTYVVHMRQPVRLLSDIGFRGFMAFQGHFAGVLIAALLHPVAYALVVHDFATGAMFSEAETLVGRNLWALAIFNMIAGYAASLALGFFVLRGRKIRGLIPYLIFIPVYWLLISVAAYRAVWQFATDPQRWEKTEHGITRQRRPRPGGWG